MTVIQLCALPGSGVESFAKALNTFMYTRLPATQRVRRLSVTTEVVSDAKKLGDALRTHVADRAVIILTSPGLCDQDNERLVPAVVRGLSKELHVDYNVMTLVFECNLKGCIANLIVGYTADHLTPAIPPMKEADAFLLVTASLRQFNAASDEDSIPLISPNYKFAPVSYSSTNLLPPSTPPTPPAPSPAANQVVSTVNTPEGWSAHVVSEEFPTDEEWELAKANHGFEWCC